MIRHLGKRKVNAICALGLALISSNAQSAEWLYLGPTHYESGGFLEWRGSVTVNESPQNTSTSKSSQLGSFYNIALRQKSRGYISKPWISQFQIDSNVNFDLNDFHNPSAYEIGFRPSISGSLSFFPYSHYDSQLNLAYTPSLSYAADGEFNQSEHAKLSFVQNYAAQTYEGQYSGRYIRTYDTEYYALNGAQLIERNDFRQDFTVQKSGINNQQTSNTTSGHIRHSYRPEFSGVVMSNMVSAVDIAPATGPYTGPLPVVFNTSLSYMYDAEYVDLNTVPSINGGASLVLDSAGILDPQMTASVSVGWPSWQKMQMSTHLNYSTYGDSTSTTLAHNARLAFKSKVVGQIKYDRYLQGALQNRWATRNNQLSWNLGGGHAVRYPQVYEMLQPISVGITQDLNLSGNTDNSLQGGSLSHSAIVSTTRNDITLASSLSDSRSYQFASNSQVAVQSAQMSLAKPLINDSYIESNAKLNVQWQQTQKVTGDTTSQSVSLQYQYDNRRIANQRDLSGNYTVIGKADSDGNSLSASGAINYRIGSVQIAGKSSVNVLNNKSFSAELNVKRFF